MVLHTLDVAVDDGAAVVASALITTVGMLVGMWLQHRWAVQARELDRKDKEKSDD